MAVSSRRGTPDLGIKENWYHTTLSREDAEKILWSGGGVEGLFLVRKSQSSVGDFVLSVIHGDTVIHYQIRRRGEDALFSLSTEERVIHGLDQLIHFYQTCESSGLQHKLSDWVPASVAPPDTRLHGTENLLHRAASEGNAVVVSELLASEYRNLSAKNHESRTAVHLASLHGHLEVLKLLLKYGAKANYSDSEGFTALHYTCQANQYECAKILLHKGGANPTLRNELTRWVPLHEAAFQGHLDSCVVLLEAHAPLAPRTPKNETPLDLARGSGHLEVANFLSKYPTPYHNTHLTEWYHPNIDRKKAVSLLIESSKSKRDGTFLIRNSTKKKRFYVLSMLWKGKGHHFEIEKAGVYFFIDEGPYMTSLEHLVQHYSRFSDGLPCPLALPVAPKEVSESLSEGIDLLKLSDRIYRQQPSLPASGQGQMSVQKPTISAPHSTNPFLNFNTVSNTPVVPPKSGHKSADEREKAPLRLDEVAAPEAPPRVPCGREKPGPLPEGLRPLERSNTYVNNETLRRVRHSKDNVPLESIKLTAIIGEGEFGSVYQGHYMTEGGEVMDVAIKALSSQAGEQSGSHEFLSEAKVMMKLDHQCIVQLIGVSHGPPVLMILELVPLGSMLSYLEENPEKVSPDWEIPLWASQIACGMSYLQSKKYVHRDLAARNILLASKYQTKISDFGLSRVMGDTDYYRATRGGRWPVKWYAPECINYGTFSSASDVWSYGVVLWEMYSYGEQPFKDKTGAKTVEYIEAGHRLAMPKRATNNVYDIMLKCWEQRPCDRPSFDELFSYFCDNPDNPVSPIYANLTELLKTQDLQELGLRESISD